MKKKPIGQLIINLQVFKETRKKTQKPRFIDRKIYWPGQIQEEIPKEIKVQIMKSYITKKDFILTQNNTKKDIKIESLAFSNILISIISFGELIILLFYRKLY